MTIEQNMEDLCRERLIETADAQDPVFMSQEELKKFEKTPFLNFGVYSKKPIRDIPVEYLEFVSSSGSFYKQLRRYLRTIQR